MRILLFLLFTSLAVSAQSTVDFHRSLVTLEKADQDERRILAQLPVGRWKEAHPELLSKHDEQRRAQVRAFLTQPGWTVDDEYNAAVIMQHGTIPADFLLAHNLAVLAAAHGKKEALWLAAATLDRYLHSIWQPQVFGTQFHCPSGSDPKDWTMDPYDPSLPDTFRKAYDVQTRAANEERLRQIRENQPVH